MNCIVCDMNETPPGESLYRGFDRGRPLLPNRSRTLCSVLIAGLLLLLGIACDEDNPVKSTEPGWLTWDLVWGAGSEGLGINDIHIHPIETNLVWAGGETNRLQMILVRSLDLGMTWDVIDLRMVTSDNAILRITSDPESEPPRCFRRLRYVTPAIVA